MSKITREEAIQCIKHELLINVNRKDLTGQAIGEALDMAIEALQSTMSQERVNHESTNDLISRADVLEGLKHSTAYLHDDIYTIVNRIPSAETTGALDDAIAKYVADGLMELPVVRCKNCRYFKKITERCDSGLCHRDIVASAWKENGYCSRGKRKGGGTE